MDLDTSVQLIDLAEAKEYLGISGAGSDAIIQALINSVSSWIRSFVRRDLLTKTYTEYYNGNGGQRFMLQNVPVTSVTSVHVDSLRVFGASTLIDSSNYIIKKQTGILLASNLYGYWSPGEANIKAVYVAGYTVTGDESAGGLPHAIRMAIKRTIDHHYRSGYTSRKLDVASESIGDRNTSYRDGKIPPDAVEMLNPYRMLMGSPDFSHAD